MRWLNIAIIIILIAGVFISFNYDSMALSYAQSTRTPQLDNFMGWMTYFGNIFLVLIVISSLFLWNERKQEWIPTLWVSFLSSILLGIALKLVFLKPRPIVDTIYPVANFVNYSFPSIHAAAAFAALPILDKEFPKFKWFWILFVLLVAYSRVYLGVHYLSDVIAGAALGYAVGCLFAFIEDKFRIFKKIMRKLTPRDRYPRSV